MSARRRRDRGRGGDGIEGNLGDEQGLAALLHHRAVLLDDLDVEARDRLRRPRAAVAQLRQLVVDEDRIADEDGADEFPAVDPEEGDRGLAQFSSAGPHQPMGIGKAQHPMGDLAAELAALRVDIAGMELGIVAGEPGEAHQIGTGDRPAGAAETHSDEEILIAVTKSRLFCHDLSFRFRSGEPGAIAYLQARSSPSAGRYSLV